MILWLLEKTVLENLETIQSTGFIPSDEQHERYIAAFNAQSPISSTTGVTAEINVSGLLTSKVSFFAMMLGLGGTTFSSIRQSIAEAEADSTVKDIVFRFNSPGGEAGADFVETMAAIRNTSKPTIAVVGNMAASAAFGLAAQADKIIAQNEMSIVGSVGAVTTRWIDKNKIDITSSNAPLKRPDITTDEGIESIRKTVDEIEAVFIDNIAMGRGTTAENIKANFGKGAPVLAKEALASGMIDSISNSDSNNSQTRTAATLTAQTKNKESKNMDLTQLKADHPAVYQAAVNEGVTKGESTERDRVNAHLVLGKASGDMETAISAVEDGSEMTATIQAKYMAASMNKKDQTALVVEDETTGATTEKTNADTDDTEAQDMELANAVVANYGGAE